MIIDLMKKFLKYSKLLRFQKQWRKINRTNYTTAGTIFPIDKVTVGEMTYGKLNIRSYGNPNEKMSIGSYCSIAGDVKFLLGGEHFYKGISTYPFKKLVMNGYENTITKGPIIVHDDVWIGENSMILSGVTIGKGAIIAAGSIVSKNISPYAIFAGGKIIKYRFSQDIINILEEFEMNKLDRNMISKNIGFLDSSLNADSLEEKLMKLLAGEVVDDA